MPLRTLTLGRRPFLAAGLGAPAILRARQRPPNVILLITDDQGYGDLACHGNPWLRTPNLGRLHAESVRFTDFHTDPLCAPTRAALLTGQYALGNGVTAATGGWSLLRPGVATMADMFRAAGYRTGIFGKWHLGENYPLRPSERGFDESIVCRGGGIAQSPDYWGNNYFDDTFYEQNKPRKFKGYCTDVFFEQALSFVERNRNRPFFLYLPTNAPHDPFIVDERYSAPYRKMGVPERTAAFYGMIENIDENLGKLLSRLNRLGLAEDTVFLFMTDNGTSAGVPRKGTDPASWPGFPAGMRANKGAVYEGGHRVPLFIRYPGGGWRHGVDRNELTCHLDLLPTLAQICSLEIPKGHRLDGHSLTPLMTGKGDFPRDRTHFIEHHQIREGQKFQMENPRPWRHAVALRGRWRLVFGRELYDLRTDPEQRNDIAAKHPELAADLRRQYDAWWSRMQAGFSSWVRIHAGNPAENPLHLTCFDWHGEYIPSSQEMVKANLIANGVWALDVERAGTYEVTLRQRPDYVAHVIEAEAARMWVNNREHRGEVKPGTTGVVIRAAFPAGRVDLKTELVSGGVSRGAYYADVLLPGH